MAVDKLVDSAQLDADLTSVANAIRTKGGTSASLAFPADFITAINAISGGGGYSVEDIFMGNEPSGAVSFKATGNVPAYGISGRKKITELTIDLTDGYRLIGYAVCNNGGTLTRIIVKNPATATGSRQGSYAITANNTMTQLIMRGESRPFDTSGIRANTNLTVLDIESLVKINSPDTDINNNEFYGCSKLNVLILRKSSLQTLGNIAAFGNTPFASGKAGGTLYVPNSLISTYQGASNWSTILGYANNSIAKIEDSPYESLTWYAS